MDDLSKHQLILLVLLITFVTSIATGIITTSLLNEAPVEVRQTINRVVEKTVETVVPEGDNEGKEKVVTVTETVVVSEEDRIVDSIKQNKESIVRIFGSSGQFIAIGIVSTKEGKIVAQLPLAFNTRSDYKAVFEDGAELPLSFKESEGGLGYFEVNWDEEGVEKKDLAVAKLSKGVLQLGQTVARITGSQNSRVLVERVAEVIDGENGNIEKLKITGSQGFLVEGEILVNLSGEIVGVYSSQEAGYIPIKSVAEKYSFLSVKEPESDNSSVDNTASAIQAN